MFRFLLVCAGGAIGSGARYLASTWAARALGPDFPRGTLLVNVTGSFALAFLLAREGAVSPEVRLFVGSGILGGYTTYSSFNYETIALLDGGRPALAAVNLALTVFSCLASGAAGLALGRWLSG